MIATSPDDRVAAGIGRRARLELVFAERNGRTVLAHAYVEPPIRIGRSFEEGRGLHIILASSSPGIFGADRYEQTVRVEPGARVRLTSQSALQVHPSPEGHRACLSSVYDIAPGGWLSCHWDPIIPFAGSRLEQRIEVRVAEGGRLYWSDAFTAGRQAHGETWRFSSLDHELRLIRGERLDYLERYRLEPREGRLMQTWVSADATCFGTALLIGERQRLLADVLHAEVTNDAACRAAADAVDPDFMIVRLMAGSSVPFHAARRRVRRLAEELAEEP